MDCCKPSPSKFWTLGNQSQPYSILGNPDLLWKKSQRSLNDDERSLPKKRKQVLTIFWSQHTMFWSWIWDGGLVFLWSFISGFLQENVSLIKIINDLRSKRINWWRKLEYFLDEKNIIQYYKIKISLDGNLFCMNLLINLLKQAGPP